MSENVSAHRPWFNLLFYAILIATAVVVIFPLWYAVTTSLVSDQDVSRYPPLLAPTTGLHWENFLRAMQLAPLPRFLLNSFVQSGLIMLSHLALASLAAYAFSFLAFRGKNFWFLVFLSTMMIPWEATIIPNYLTIRGLHWTDTYLGLAAPYMATAFGTFLLRQFFLSIPKDLHDAAVIDGCSDLRFLLTVLVPLARPALGTLAVYSFLQAYNQYLWPLLVTSNKNMRTVQIGIAMLQDEERFAWNVVMAGVVIVLIPTFLLFIFGNRQLIRGLTAGAVKG
jgi:ABC-type glycerol-3-phosphate transport system permease component